MNKIELLKEEALQQQWRGQAQLEALNLAEIVGKPDINGERISDDLLAGLFWNIIYAGNFNYNGVGEVLQRIADEAAANISEAA